jgi:hypothetical protein
LDTETCRSSETLSNQVRGTVDSVSPLPSIGQTALDLQRFEGERKKRVKFFFHWDAGVGSGNSVMDHDIAVRVRLSGETIRAPMARSRAGLTQVLPRRSLRQ